MALCKCFCRSIRNFVIFFFAVAFLPGLPPHTQFPIKSITIKPARELTGTLALNNYLDKTERLYEGRLAGPECLKIRDNDIYVSLQGKVVKINGEHITHVAQFGPPCESHQHEICGHPLGMDFDTISNSLIVADAYHGIWSVDLNTLKKTQLIAPDIELDGIIKRSPKVFNSVAVAKNGDIYWTDSSSEFYLMDGLKIFLTNPSGRLIHYSRAQRTNRVLLDELHCANGLVLSPQEDFVVVAETVGGSLQRYYLAGPKKGQSDIFADSFPGLPDNLSADNEGIWVPLVIATDAAHPAPYQSAGPTPLIRKFVLRLMELMEIPFRLINQVYPNYYCQISMNMIGSLQIIIPLIPDRKTVLRLNWNGDIVSTLHGFDKSVTFITHIEETNGYLLLGSFLNNYIGRVKLPAGFIRGDSVHTAPKTTTTTTTTTSRPTTTTTTTTTTPRPTSTTTTTTTTPPPTTTTTPKPTQAPVKQPQQQQHQPPLSPSGQHSAKSESTGESVTGKSSGDGTKHGNNRATNEGESTKFSKTDGKSGQQVRSSGGDDGDGTGIPRIIVEKKPPPPTPTPIHEEREDLSPPKPEKMKIINRGGEQGEF